MSSSEVELDTLEGERGRGFFWVLWGGMFKCGEGGRRLRDGVLGGTGTAFSLDLTLEMIDNLGGS